MTLLLADGFGWLETKTHTYDAAPYFFSSGQWAAVQNDVVVAAYATGRKTVGRDSNYGLRLATKTLGSLSRVVCGVRVVSASPILSSQAGLINFYDGTASLGTIFFDQTGEITYKNYKRSTGTTIATATANVAQPGVTYVEADITFHNSAGIVKIWVNGALVCNETGVDTIGTNGGFTPGTVCTKITFDGTSIYEAMGTVTTLTDIYVDSDTQHGDVKIETKACTVAGSESDWSPAASTNISQVDEIPTDDDTTYVNSAVNGDRDAYKCAAMTGIGEIKAIIHQLRLRKEDANDGQVKIGAQISGSEDQTADLVTGGTDYEQAVGIFELNPDTGVAFLESELTSLELTVENTSV